MFGRHVPISTLRSLVRGHPPFVSVYLDVEPGRREGLVDRIDAAHRRLVAAGIDTTEADAVLAHFVAPAAEHAAIGVIRDAAGTTLVATSPDPLVEDLVDVGRLPRLGPILEWQQGNVGHVVAIGDSRGFDVVSFTRTGDTPMRVVDDDDDPALLLAHLAEAVRGGDAIDGDVPHLVFVVSSRADTNTLVEGLRALLPEQTTVERIDAAPTGDLAEEVVRRCATHVAGRKVEFLRRFRADLARGHAVDGVDDVVRAVNDERVSALLIHADPHDRRIAALDDSGRVIPAPPDTVAGPTRLVDALIARTLVGGGLPVVIPSTDPRMGPRDDLGALLEVAA